MRIWKFGLCSGPVVRHLSIIVIVLLRFLCPAICSAADQLPRSVLIIDQSDPDTPWSIGFRGAFRSALAAGSATPVGIYSETLDLARFGSSEYDDVLRTYFRVKYRDKPIGVIVVHGSTALEFLLRLRL